ncbi:hypothetical protein AGOR_G00015170 [Albula goreensis]|uniref:Fibronectin type-III domain-containing protein n=1 Tax=Albula goreensis TaxID=1534307 RepID=A0A8T3EAZ5_9TELE|nr:hypothetical protein AGOR_G00015170 [Albula goreensis]
MALKHIKYRLSELKDSEMAVYHRVLLLLSWASMVCASDPPEKPENISCIVVQSGTELSPEMTCSWFPGKRDPILPTNYTLFMQVFEKLDSNPASKDNGKLKFSTMPIFTNVDIWVEVENSLGKVKSEVLRLDPEEIVKTNPPINVTVTSEDGFPTSLWIRWKHPIRQEFFELKYNIRYCKNGSHVWTEVPPTDTVGYIQSFRLQSLEPYTDYIVQVRCINNRDLGYWSEWSQNVTRKTPEAMKTNPRINVTVTSEDFTAILSNNKSQQAINEPPEFCCGKIFPETPVLELGKEFTATCVLSALGKRDTGATADDIYWEFKKVRVSRERYTKINDSAVSMTVNVTSQLESPLTCHVSRSNSAHGHINRNVHGMFFTAGYPPEKPENISCIVVQSGTELSPEMTCSWFPGKRDPILPTNYTLFMQVYEKQDSNPASKDNGKLKFSTMPIFTNVDIWVEVENSLGKVKSEVLRLDPEEIVKTNPPLYVSVTSEDGFPTSLLIRWKHPIRQEFFELKYNIRYCKNGSHVWTEVPPTDTVGYIQSFRLQSLEPYTDYVVQVRCINNRDLGYWSEWSQNVTRKTPEATPSSKPDLWRVIIPSADNTAKRVRLMWKDPVHSNGRILGYNLTIKKERKTESLMIKSSGGRKMYELEEVKGAVLVYITAHNSVGVSKPASLLIPREDQVPSQLKKLSWLSQHGSLWVSWEWERDRHRPTEFVLEWLSVSDGSLDWQREPGNASSAALKGELQPFKRYNITVYPVLQGKPKKPLTVAAYLQQGPPSIGPSLKVTQNGKTEVWLEWEELPLDSQNGFITNYTLFYKSGNVEKSIVLPPSNKSYTLKNLLRETKYVVRVMASTVAGSTNGSEFTFSTLKYAPGEIEAIVVLVCIGFLFFTVLTVLVCINKKEMIKKHIWPQVPDPSNSTIANWSPDFPSRPDTPKEGSLTDVSVVEVDVFEKKSLAEEDKTSLPLKKDKYLSEEHSSGIGGSSCMSSPRQSVSDSDEGGDSGQTTASTVQYSSVVASGYKGQTPAQAPAVPPTFARSESTQPLLEGEDHHDGDLHGPDPASTHRYPRNPYFRRNRTVEGGTMLKLHQIEIAEQSASSSSSSSSLGFCPVEEGSQQTTPTAEVGVAEDPTPSYMPQRSGYRPQ